MTIGIEIAFDSGKDARNVKKHGVSLAAAARFDFDTALERVDIVDGEERWVALGFLDAALYVLVYTLRGEDTVRPISLRKATPGERKSYVQEI